MSVLLLIKEDELSQLADSSLMFQIWDLSAVGHIVKVVWRSNAMESGAPFVTITSAT